MLKELRDELVRLKAADVQLQSDERLGHIADSLVKVTIEKRSYSVTTTGLLEMLKSLPNGATETAVKEVLEMRTEQLDPASNQR